MRGLRLATILIAVTMVPCGAGAQLPDHLKCYKIKDPVKLTGVLDLDTPQFGPEAGCKVSKAKLFCVPATKSVVSADDKATGLPITPLPVTGVPTAEDRVCYKIKCDAQPANQQVTDQFGTRTLEKLKAFLVCTPAVKGTAYCGDGVKNGAEACDDGDLGGATCASAGFNAGTLACGQGCALDTSACACGSSCGDGVCGDGVTDFPIEACDDGNSHPCGSCESDCRNPQPAAAATGLILALDATSFVDGESFTVDDGLGTSVVFEFDTASNGVTPGNTAITVLGSDPASLVAQLIESAIVTSALQIDAATQSNLVFLLHQVATGLGNQAITHTVVDPDFYVAGMNGGAGADCPAGIDCSSDFDCAPGLECDAGTCAVVF